MRSLPLGRPITLDNGKVLRTLEDVRELVVSIPSDLVRHEKWQCLAQMIMDVALGGDVELVGPISAQLRHCLETRPYASVRLMPEPPYRNPSGASHRRKKLVP
jgi:hypothetical protein